MAGEWESVAEDATSGGIEFPAPLQRLAIAIIPLWYCRPDNRSSVAGFGDGGALTVPVVTGSSPYHVPSLIHPMRRIWTYSRGADKA
jgi:hypothetical protein